MIAIARRFVDLPWGQVHYREAGSGPVAYLCHGSPGSARALEPLMHALAPHMRVIAPDTPGNGDSVPLAAPRPSIADLAGSHRACLDAIGIEPALVFGTHTGAAIAVELALAAGGPPSFALVLDGLGIFDADTSATYLRRYADPFEADLDGAWLARLFQFCRDQYIFFPWYARDRDHLLGWSLPTADQLADSVVEVAKARNSYHHSYRAAFAYPALERIAQLDTPVLLMAATDDPLRAGTILAAERAPQGRFLALPTYADAAFLPTQSRAILDQCR